MIDQVASTSMFASKAGGMPRFYYPGATAGQGADPPISRKFSAHDEDRPPVRNLCS